MRTIALAAALCASPALAQALTDPAAIEAAVASFTGAPMGAPGGAALPVDRRLRLASCATALAVGWYGTRQDTVLVQCPSADWRLFVPLRIDGAAAAPPAVARGDAVTIVVAGEGFAVSQSGEALDAGAVGAWIRVRTGSPRAQPLRARVLRPGQVGIDLP